MIRRQVLLGLLVALACLRATPSPADDDAAAVRDAFSAYRSAILSGQGEVAASLLSASTHAYYDEMRQLALYGSAKAVQEQSLVDQVQVLLLRLRVPADELASFTPQGIIAYSVDRGWIGKESVLQLQPGQVRAEGDFAVIHVVVDGRDVGPGFQLRRESGSWRLDLVPTLQSTNASLQLAARQQGVSEREFVLVLMESALGRKLGPEAWRPPRTRPGP